MNKNKLFYFILGFILIIFIIYMMNYTSIIEGATNNDNTIQIKLFTTIDNNKKYLATNMDMNKNCINFKLIDDINSADVFTYNKNSKELKKIVAGNDVVYCTDIKPQYNNRQIYYLKTETITGVGQTAQTTNKYALQYKNNNLSFGVISSGPSMSNIIKFDNIEV